MFPYKLIDLTYPLCSQTPSWTGGCGFAHEIKLDYDQCKTDVKFRVQKIIMHAGIGTHIDAPAHCIDSGLTVDKLDLNNLLSPCKVIDISHKAHENYQLSVQDIKDFEKEYGKIDASSFVCIKTGWGRFWHKPDQYRNNHVFPSLSAEAASYLLAYDISGLAIDTLSPDCPRSGFPVHQSILGAGKYIVENIFYSDDLPLTGAYIMALPIKTIGGTEAPIRLVGLVKKGL